MRGRIDFHCDTHQQRYEKRFFQNIVDIIFFIILCRKKNGNHPNHKANRKEERYGLVRFSSGKTVQAEKKQSLLNLRERRKTNPTTLTGLIDHRPNFEVFGAMA